jgi:hypothetical protein
MFWTPATIFTVVVGSIIVSLAFGGAIYVFRQERQEEREVGQAVQLRRLYH